MKNSRSIPHPTISQVKIIDNRNNFPISWLNKQGFCEYGIYLENVRGIEVKPTKAMVQGTVEHAVLEADFKEGAQPATFEKMLETSETSEILSREFPVISSKYGIRGFIDEVWMTPDEFMIIDDKPGTVAYYSSINQVYGYCLAFKDMVDDDRKIIGALRQRGTDNVYWSAYFNNEAEINTINLVNRVHELLVGKREFVSTKNPNKCRGCRFNSLCDKRLDF